MLWCLSHWGWVVVVCVLAGAIVPLFVNPPVPQYEAAALVYARQLNVNARALPRMAEDVFAEGTVEARVATELDLGGSSSPIVPERLSVVAAEDSIVLVVQGRDPDPGTAARLATVGADALVQELNRLGPGVGEFALQSEAVEPPVPVPQQTLPVRIALGGLAGAAIGLGLVAMIAAIRRPVVSSRDVEEATRTPLLGTVRLPNRGGFSGPLGVRGIATVTRWLASVPPGRLMLVSAPEDTGVRHRIFVMCGVGLWTLRSVRLEAPGPVVAAVQELCAQHRDAGRVVHERRDPAGTLSMVDGGSPIDSFDRVRGTISVVAVARVGTPRRRLRAVTTDFTGSGLIGIILVDVRSGRSRSDGPGRSTPSSPPARTPVPLAS